MSSVAGEVYRRLGLNDHCKLAGVELSPTIARHGSAHPLSSEPYDTMIVKVQAVCLAMLQPLQTGDELL